MTPVRVENVGMDDTEPRAAAGSGTDRAIGRRALFGRALLLAGASATVLALSGCPGGDQDDDDDDGDDDD